ncbi:hypothetical protein [Burkholderia multivorans]|uniref:hypothetical protein n=1 Tax=Burkholderia multivorans TaxID=87883 RepID=UPI0011B25792|nr:hypothetical protein [Burkholderia multivorans]
MDTEQQSATTVETLLREVVQIETRFANAAANIDAAVRALIEARIAFLEVDAELQTTAKQITAKLTAQGAPVQICNHGIAHDQLKLHISRMFGEAGAQLPLAAAARQQYANVLAQLMRCVYQPTSLPRGENAPGGEAWREGA